MTTTSIAFFIAGLISALGHLWLAPRPVSALRSLVKTLPLGLFALSAFAAAAHPFLIMALLLSAAGDLALSRPGRRMFLYGLACFALVHVLYALLFLSLSEQPIWAAFGLATLPALAMLALAVSTELWLQPHAGSLRWPVRVYIVLIGAMMLSALTLPGEMRLAIWGAAAFVASDAVLAVERFRLGAHSRWRTPAQVVLWGLYIGGQALILRSLLVH